MISGAILLKQKSFRKMLIFVSGKNYFFRIVFIFLISIPFCSLAQKDTAKVRLISADLLEYNKSVKPDYQILTGRVVFEYEGTLLYCDQADIYINRDLVVAKGNVHIILNDTTHMYSDSLRIDGDRDLAEMIGNVKLIDNEATLTTDRLYYDLKNDIAYYLTGGEITDPESYITSEKGYYHQKTKDVYFRDSVYIRNKDTEIFSDTLMYNTKTEMSVFYGKTRIEQPENTMICELGTYDAENEIGRFSKNVEMYSGSRTLMTDSLFYNKPDGYSEAFRNVFFQDTTDQIILNSHYGKFFETDSTFFATDSALLRIIEKADTLYLHADSLFMVNDTTLHMQKVIYAYHKARIWRHDFQAVSDSIVFLNTDSLLYLYKDPLMWLEETQLVADTIFVTYQDGEMERLFMRKNAFIVSRESANDFQQIKSSNMEGIFANNKLDKLWANDTARTLYYIFDDDMLLIGINKSLSERVKISFQENKVDYVVFYNHPDGTLNPYEELSESDKIIDGFRWEQSIRPQYPEDVFRDPAIEPEAKERKVLFGSHVIPSDTLFAGKDTLQINDTLQADTTDQLMKSQSITSGKATLNPKHSNTDSANPEQQDSPEVQLQQPKECFLKRWTRKCRERKVKKNQ
jgi:lipopolysaccharide export system protein LptA